VSTTAGERRPRAGHVPESPTKLTLSEWIAVFKRAAKQFMADDCMGLAQQVAYSSMLAFFPAVAFVLGFLGLTHLYDKVQSFLATVAPHGVIHFIETLQKDSKGSASATAFVIGLFGAVWAASGAMSSVVKAVNRAYDRIETRPFWKVRLISVFLVSLSGLVTAAMLILVIFGGPLGNAISRKAHLSGAFDLVWAILRWPIAFAAVLLFFALVYYLAPNKEQRDWKWITPGSLVGALLWLILSGLFALYASFSGSYSKTYGSLAAGVILLLWLNYTAWAILFGAELNAELDREADIRAAGGPDAGLIQPAKRVR
jgi:membrane protein